MILLDAFKQLGGELLRLNISRADKIGALHGWRPSMPITHWWVTKP
jgi:precorrin-6Y C5,15-methyltransferase (decarboxylating)